jgi:hypothetical protein
LAPGPILIEFRGGHLDTVEWLVVAVVVYTAMAMLRSAVRDG